MRLGCQAHPVRCPEKCPAAGLKHSGRFAEHGLGVSHMLDDIAAVDRPECVVRKRHRFALATHQAHIAQACFVEPPAGQNEPTHGDIHPDQLIRRQLTSESDQAAAGTAANVEDRNGCRCILIRSFERCRAFENMPHLPLDVGWAEFRAMPQVISLEQLGESQITRCFVQVGSDYGVTIVAAVRVGRRP